MTDDEVEELIREVDQNQDGLIDYKEFLEMMMAKKSKKWLTSYQSVQFPSKSVIILKIFVLPMNLEKLGTNIPIISHS